MEIFKTIKQYPDYQISNLGRVWNTKTNRFIKASQKSNGYYQLNLYCRDGRRKKEYLHRLVGITFIDNPNGYPEIDHIDRDKSNNRVDNLRWVSKSTNRRNKIDNRKVAVYDRNDNFLFECGSVAEAAERTEVAASSIYSVLRGDFDSCKGFIFKKLI